MQRSYICINIHTGTLSSASLWSLDNTDKQTTVIFSVILPQRKDILLMVFI